MILVRSRGYDDHAGGGAPIPSDLAARFEFYGFQDLGGNPLLSFSLRCGSRRRC
jgi:hypothetical protein